MAVKFPQPDLHCPDGPNFIHYFETTYYRKWYGKKVPYYQCIRCPERREMWF